VPLARLHDAAEMLERFATGVFRRQTARDEVFGRQIDVRRHLFVESFVHAPAGAERRETREEDAQRGHARSSDGERNRSMMSAALAQFSVSAFSCFRPARVIE
jgi:hypothetical protein